MHYSETIVTTAGTAAAWAVVADVTDWPRWTASMSEVAPLDQPTLAPGGRFRVRQPGLPTTVWRVQDLQPGASFAWETHAPGVRTFAYHRVEAQPDGTTRISIGIEQSGALAWLVTLLTASRTRRYLRMEAAALKAAAESGTVPPPAPADGTATEDTTTDGVRRTGGQ
ncbi:SRPBCC family protein [Micromonospora schwarzwaldensis]|uniref:SRPBCC family protein n=1 Tax=Micromonospora sp. DSM 45708 TaxID=3111767 RepID=UPI0031DBC4B1